MPEIGSSRSISGCIAIPAPRPSSRPTVCSKTVMSAFVTRLSSVAAARPANDPPTISTVQRLKSVVITGSSLVPKPAVSVHKLRTAPRCGCHQHQSALFGTGASDSVKRQWWVVAVEMFDGGEDKFGLADVLDVVEQKFAWPEMEVTCFAGGIRHIASGAVMGVLPAVAGVNGGPKVVEHMAMGVPAFTGRQSDFPHADAVVLAQ